MGIEPTTRSLGSYGSTTELTRDPASPTMTGPSRKSGGREPVCTI